MLNFKHKAHRIYIKGVSIILVVIFILTTNNGYGLRVPLEKDHGREIAILLGEAISKELKTLAQSIHPFDEREPLDVLVNRVLKELQNPIDLEDIKDLYGIEVTQDHAHKNISITRLNKNDILDITIRIDINSGEILSLEGVPKDAKELSFGDIPDPKKTETTEVTIVPNLDRVKNPWSKWTTWVLTPAAILLFAIIPMIVNSETDNKVGKPAVVAETIVDSYENKQVEQMLSSKEMKEFVVDEYEKERISNIVKAWLRIGLDINQLPSFLEDIKNIAGNYDWWAFDIFPEFIDICIYAGIDNTKVLFLFKDDLTVIRDQGFLGINQLLPITKVCAASGIMEITQVPIFLKDLDLPTYVFGSILKAMESCINMETIDRDSIPSFLKDIHNVAQEYTGVAYDVLPELLELMPYTEVPSLLEKTRAIAGKWTVAAYHSLPTLLKFIDFSQLPSFFKDFHNVAGDYPYMTYGDLPELGTSLKEANVSLTEEVKKSIIVITKYSSKDAQNMYKLIGELKMDLRKCTTKEGFAQEFAYRLNDFCSTETDYDKLYQTLNRASAMLYLIHSRENELDRVDTIRRMLIKNLDNRSVYYLFSFTGATSYSIGLIYNTHIRPNASAFIKEIETKIDPKHNYAVGFVLTLSEYGLVEKVIKANPKYFISVIESSMNQRENIVKNCFLLTRTFISIFQDKSLSQYKPQSEKLLLTMYDKYINEYNINAQGAIGYLIKLNSRYFSAKNRGQALKISKALPKILLPLVPEKWLSDKALITVLRFHEDEIWWYEDTKSYYYKELGFTEPKEIYKDTWKLTKTINGITLGVIVTISDDYINPDLDIFGARSHIYHNKDDVKAGVPISSKEIGIYLGGCVSDRLVPELWQEGYTGNYFISDQNTGEGAVSNKVIYYLMEAIAKGERSWPQIKTYISERSDAEGIVFPHDNRLLMLDFIEELKKMNSGKKETTGYFVPDGINYDMGTHL